MGVGGGEEEGMIEEGNIILHIGGGMGVGCGEVECVEQGRREGRELEGRGGIYYFRFNISVSLIKVVYLKINIFK